jgi:hypothetical protein
MRHRTKLFVSVVMLVAAFAIAYDAHAGNLRSASTPSTLFWFAAVNTDNGLSWNGEPSNVRILIDDIIYTGLPQPGEVPGGCFFQDQCSFWNPEAMPEGTLDFGPLNNYNNGQTYTYNDPEPPLIVNTWVYFYDSATTNVHTVTRGWYHEIVVQEENGLTIDKFQLIGSNSVAVKERKEIQGTMTHESVDDVMEQTTTHYGSGGLGVGIGVGLGATSFMVGTTDHRAYQTPFIVAPGTKILVGANNWQNAMVMFHGRIITDSGEFPTRVSLTPDAY